MIVDNGSEDWVFRPFDPFDLPDKNDDYRIMVGNRAYSDLKRQATPQTQDDVHKDLGDLRRVENLKRRTFKKLGDITESNGQKTPLYQCDTKHIGSKGRYWFVLKDEAPPQNNIPSLLLLGCEIGGHKKNTRRIRNLLKLSSTDIMANPILVNEAPKPSKGRAVEWEGDYSIRQWEGDDFQEAIEFAKSEMNILPTPEQYRTVMREDLPIFINGQAGTGKTVMLCYRVTMELGVRTTVDPSRKFRTLVTSMSESIVEKMESFVETGVAIRLKKKLSPEDFDLADDDFRSSIESENRESWTRPMDFTRFLCFRPFRQIQLDLLSPPRRLLYVDNVDDPTERHIIGFSKFSSDFFSKRDYAKKGLQVELAWFGIRSVVRGLCGDYNGNYLSHEQILKHEDRWRSLFTKNQIKLLSKCHEDYTKWLSSEHLFDHMDLARDAWLSIKAGAEFTPFDDIYLDEAQDLTELELRILYSLLKEDRVNHLILAGDPLQTINPTGFTWDAVSSMIWRVLNEVSKDEQKITKPMLLNQNHRTPIEIVRWGNMILKKRAHYQREQYVEQISNLQEGSVSLNVIDETHSGVISKIMYQVADRFIIASRADEEGLERLVNEDQYFEKQEGGSIHLESITGIKGHEEDTVILYRMAEDLVNNKDTRKILAENLDRDRIDGQQMVRLCYELNKLYIGLTRSKSKLIILENERTLELFWESGIFSEVIGGRSARNSVEETMEMLEVEFTAGEDPSVLREYALRQLKIYLEDDPTVKRLEWAKAAAKKANPPLDPRDLHKINAYYYKAKAYQSGIELEEKLQLLKLAASEFRATRMNRHALDIWLDDVKDPRLAWNAMKDHAPNTFRTGTEYYTIAAMYSTNLDWPNPDDDNFENLCNIIENGSRPKWWLPEHSTLLSGQFLKICNDCLDPDQLISKYKETAGSKFFNQSESESWYENWCKLMKSQYQTNSRLWNAIDERFNESKLSPSTSNPLHESHVVMELLNSTGSVLLEESKTVTSRINIMMKWYDSTGKSEETKYFPRKVIEEMIEEEFENLTAPQLSGGSPWIPKLSGHINNINWANQNGYPARGKAITLLEALTSGVKAVDHYDLNSSTMSVLWECVNTKQSELDGLTENLSDFTDEEHLNKHIRIIVDNWLISKSETKGETNKFYGLRKTTCWKDCCEHRGKMSALLGFFSNQTPEQQIIRLLRCFEEGLQKGDGRTEFDTKFQDIAANVLSKDPRTQTQSNLRKALCEKGKWAFFERRKIHQSHKTFAEAYRVYKKETVQVSNEKLEETANSFESIGEDTLARETRNRIVKPPSEIISDTIANSDLDDQQKVATILQALIGQGTSRQKGGSLSATDRKKLFVEYILDDFDLRLILLQNFKNFREDLTTIAKGIKSNPSDDPIILHLRSHPNNFFQFLWAIDKGKVELLDPIQQHKEAIWFDVGETCSQLTNTEFGSQYTEAIEYCKRSFFRKETHELAFRAASLIALYAQLESQPTNDALAAWRKYFGQSPKAKDKKADHLRELLSEFEGNLLYDVGLLEAYARILDK